MKKSLGLLEVKGFACAVDIADIMAKTANIEIKSIKLTKGLGYVMLTVTGDVGAVNAAIHAGEIAALNYQSLVTSKVIARPIKEIYSDIFKEKKAIKEENITKEFSDFPSKNDTLMNKDKGTGKAKTNHVENSVVKVVETNSEKSEHHKKSHRNKKNHK